MVRLAYFGRTFDDLCRPCARSSPHHYYGLDWVQQIREAPIPAIPILDEEMSSVEKRARELVGKVRCPRKFEPVHPLVSKLLAHDEERRREFAKWRSPVEMSASHMSGTENNRSAPVLLLQAPIARASEPASG